MFESLGLLGGLDHGDEIKNLLHPVGHLKPGDDDDRLGDNPMVWIVLVQ